MAEPLLGKTEVQERFFFGSRVWRLFHVLFVQHQGCKTKPSLSLCYITEKQTNYFIEWSDKVKLRSLTVWGVGLLCNLVVQQLIRLYLWSDGTGVSRLRLGWVLSLSILWALCRHLNSPISLVLSRLVDVQAIIETLNWKNITKCRFVFLTLETAQPQQLWSFKSSCNVSFWTSGALSHTMFPQSKGHSVFCLHFLHYWIWYQETSFQQYISAGVKWMNGCSGIQSGELCFESDFGSFWEVKFFA